jgi:hypothetical protein
MMLALLWHELVCGKPLFSNHISHEYTLSIPTPPATAGKCWLHICGTLQKKDNV